MYSGVVYRISSMGFYFFIFFWNGCTPSNVEKLILPFSFHSFHHYHHHRHSAYKMLMWIFEAHTFFYDQYCAVFVPSTLEYCTKEPLVWRSHYVRATTIFIHSLKMLTKRKAVQQRVPLYLDLLVYECIQSM